MKLHLPQDGGVTIIENDFIDLYMPYANGEFVKVYLYFLVLFHMISAKQRIHCHSEKVCASP